jgi:hypothetical protein
MKQKNGSGKKKAVAEEQDPTIDMSTFVGQKARSKQAEVEMDPNDTRQRNKMARYGAKLTCMSESAKGSGHVQFLLKNTHTHW